SCIHEVGVKQELGAAEETGVELAVREQHLCAIRALQSSRWWLPRGVSEPGRLHLGNGYVCVPVERAWIAGVQGRNPAGMGRIAGAPVKRLAGRAGDPDLVAHVNRLD